MPTLRIDDRDVTVPGGTTIIQAARGMGIEVPHYCWHPHLRPDGNCRMCLVEVKGAPKPLIACGTPVAEGMEVHTQSDLARRARRGVMEFLLINHPLDCPICDQAGECKLQEYAHDHGRGFSRFEEEKNAKPKKVRFSDTILFDGERCILCTRCIRFFQDVRGRDLIGIRDMGDRSTLMPAPPGTVDDPYSMNIIDICPVGALTSRDFRFRSRLWFMSFADTVCGHCARGCNITAGQRDGRILRFVPRENNAVNHAWMCDAGRLSFKALQEGPRLEVARVRGPAGPRDVSAGEAWHEAAVALRRAAAKDSASVAAIVSTCCTTEELWLTRRLIRDALGATRIVHPSVAGPSDGFLRHPDATPNTAGARLLGIEAGDGADAAAALLREVGSGIRALLVVGAGVDAPWDAVPPGGLEQCDVLVVIDARPSPASRAARVCLPGRTYVEKRGTFVNAQGILQRVRRVVEPPSSCPQDWESLDGILRILAPGQPWDTFEGLVRTMAADLGLPAGTTWKTIGRRGLAIEGAALEGTPPEPPPPTPMARQGLPLDGIPIRT